MTFYVTVGIALGLSALILFAQFRWIPKSAWVDGRPYSRWRINAVLVVVTIVAIVLASLITDVASESVAAWIWAVFMGVLVATSLVLVVEVALWTRRHWQWAIVVVIFVIGGALFVYFKLPGFREFIDTL